MLPNLFNALAEDRWLACGRVPARGPIEWQARKLLIGIVSPEGDSARTFRLDNPQYAIMQSIMEDITLPV